MKVRRGMGGAQHRGSSLFKSLSAVVVVALVAACGGDDSGSAAESLGTQTTEVAVDSSDAAGAPETTSADSSEWQAIVEAAKDEGEVVWYSYNNDANLQAAAEAFRKAYPEIEISVTRVLPQDGPALLEAERTTGSAGADLYMEPNTTWAEHQLAESEDRIIEPVGPNILDRPDLYLDECKCTIIGYYGNGIAWNTNLVSDDPPTALTDILDPKYAGRIAVPEATVATQYFWDYLKEYGGEDYWEKLAALDPIVYAGGAPVSQAIIAGEAAVTPYGAPNFLIGPMDEGAPVDFVMPPSDAPGWSAPYMAHILGWGKHPNAAQVLLNFLLTSDGQQAFNEGIVTVLREPVEGTSGTVDDVIPFEGSLPADEIQAHMEEWRRVFGR